MGTSFMPGTASISQQNDKEAMDPALKFIIKQSTYVKCESWSISGFLEVLFKILKYVKIKVEISCKVKYCFL